MTTILQYINVPKQYVVHLKFTQCCTSNLSNKKEDLTCQLTNYYHWKLPWGGFM